MLFILGFGYPSQAGEVRSLQMQVAQVSPATVKLTVDIFTNAHAEAPQLEICWGDGICEKWASLYVEEWPALDSRRYRVESFHGYEQNGGFTISAETCCWSEDIINFTSAPNLPVITETYFVFDSQLLNHTPLVQPFYTVCPDGICSFFPQISEEEGDSLVWELCLPNIASYIPLDEIVTGTNNSIYFDASNGHFSWAGAPFPGWYGHIFCLSEYRGEQLISRTQWHHMLIVSEEATVGIPAFQQEQDWRVFPNPAQDQWYIEGPSKAKEMNIKIYDTYGRQQWAQQGLASIPIADWAAGCYWLVGTWKGRLWVERLLKE